VVVVGAVVVLVVVVVGAVVLVVVVVVGAVVLVVVVVVGAVVVDVVVVVGAVVLVVVVVVGGIILCVISLVQTPLDVNLIIVAKESIVTTPCEPLVGNDKVVGSASYQTEAEKYSTEYIGPDWPTVFCNVIVLFIVAIFLS